MRKLVILSLILLLLPIVLATDYPSYKGYVSDYAEVISAEDEAKINALAAEIQKSTTAEIAVLTIDDLQGLDENTYAVEVFKEWGIGKKDLDNGLLILVKPKTVEEMGAWKIEVGYGLEPLITDAMAGRIGRDTMLPYFKNNEYGQGIYAGMVEIQGYIEGKEEIVSKYKTAETAYEGFDYFYVALFVALIAGGIVSLATKKIENKKVKWGVRLGVGAAVFIGFLIFDLILAFIFLALYLLSMGGRGGGFFFFGPRFGGGHGGGSGGGGFGGFGGGSSGGGGAGGRW